MNLPIFSIPEENLSSLFLYLEEKGYAIRQEDEEKKSNEGTEQYWTIHLAGKKIFIFSIFKSNKGSSFLIFGPLIDKNQNSIREILLEGIPKFRGKLVKSLNDVL